MFYIDRLTVLHLTVLTALCAILFFPHLARFPFFNKGEPREALVVQEVQPTDLRVMTVHLVITVAETAVAGEVPRLWMPPQVVEVLEALLAVGEAGVEIAIVAVPLRDKAAQEPEAR